MLCKVTHCAGRVSANTRPHQLHWGDREMGTAISCTECSQVAGLIQKLAETPRKHRLFVQLFFMQLSCVAIVIVELGVLGACSPRNSKQGAIYEQSVSRKEDSENIHPHTAY